MKNKKLLYFGIGLLFIVILISVFLIFSKGPAKYFLYSDNYIISCFNDSEKIKNVPCSSNKDCSVENMHVYCSPGYFNQLKSPFARYYCGDGGYCKGCDCGWLGIFIRNPQMPEKEIKTVEEETEEIKEITNWKTYRNEEYGFEVKYPEDLIVKTETESDLFHINFCILSENWNKGYSKELTLHISPNKEKLLLKDALAKKYDFSDLQFTEVQIENNLQALKPLRQTSEDYWKKFPMGSGLEYNYWFAGNQNFIFGINHWQDNQLDYENLKEIADQMLSTFKFIE